MSKHSRHLKPMQIAMWHKDSSPTSNSIQVPSPLQPYIKPIPSPKSLITRSTMAISTSTLLSFSLGLLLCHACLARFEHGQGQSPREGSRRLGSQSECRIEKLNAQEPKRRIESEAGHSDYYDESNEQFDCAGVSAVRRTIQPGGLLLPQFSNAPMLIYVIQGTGVTGTVIPGCPETYQSFQQSEEWSKGQERGRESQQRVKDQHQQIQHIRQGDIIALPAGVAHWCYNEGDSPLVTINVMDTSNNANQLDRQHRQFLLAGSRQQRSQEQFGRPGGESEHESSGSNILSGFDTEMLSNAMAISRDLAEKLKGRNDQRGEIVRVQGKLEVLRPSRSKSREEEEYRYEEEREERGNMNGLEQSICTMRIRENIGNPRRADVYNPDVGRLTTLNSQKLPILRYLRLSAVRGALRRNAFIAPLWKVNAHSIMYVIKGSCRCQVVSNRGQTVFNGEVRQGQILVVPQNFAQLKQATSDDFEWVTIETNDNSISSPIVGKASALKGMPEEVLMNSYRISREQARMVKMNRGEEFTLFGPRSQQGRASA